MNAQQSALEFPTLQSQARTKWGWFFAFGLVLVLLEF